MAEVKGKDNFDTKPTVGGVDVVIESDSVDVLSDVDTTTTPPVTKDMLTFDGSNWVPQSQNLIVSFALESPTTADDGLLQHKFGQAVTITRISGSTDTGTCTIQFDERSESTPNTAGTDVMSSTLVCDTDTQATTAFANANIAEDAVLNLDIDATSGTPGVVRIHVEYRPQ